MNTKSPMQELNTKQYYETVDVAELPDKQGPSVSIWVFCIDAHEDIKKCWYNFREQRWECGNDDFTPVSWLRPVSLSELIRDKLTEFLESEIKADRCDLYETPEIFSQQFINSL